MLKFDLHVTFLPDVILCCAILHNILMGQSHEDVEALMQVLRNEGMDAALLDENGGARDEDNVVADDTPPRVASDKRRDLRVYLSTQRRARP